MLTAMLLCGNTRDDKLKLMNHQQDAVDVVKNQRATLLAFSPGVGKTAVAIAALHPTEKNYIIVPASLIKNWEAELKLWDCKAKQVEVVSYNKVDWMYEAHTVIVDESHFVKNPLASRTINVKYVLGNAKKIILLTGTPIVNKLEELAVQMEMVGIPKEYSSDLDYLYKNNLLIRIKTEAVLNLPEITFNDTYIELANTQEIIAIQQEIRQIYTDSDSDFDKMWADYSMILVGKLTKIRKHVGISKVKETIRLIQQQLTKNPDEPIIVFGHHKQVLEAIADAFDAPLLYGKTSLKKRNKYVQEFQEGKHKVLACSIIAAGVGLTLTKSHKVVYVELPFTPAAYEQGYCRSWRKGQEETVNVINLISTHRVDVRTKQILESKKKIVSCLDGGNPSKEDSTEKLLIKDIVEN